MANLTQSENMIDDNYNDTKTVTSCDTRTTESHAHNCNITVPYGTTTSTTCSAADSSVPTTQESSNGDCEETVTEQYSRDCSNTDNSESCLTTNLAVIIPCDTRRSPSPAQDAIEFVIDDVMSSTPVQGENTSTNSATMTDSTSISVLDSETDLSSVTTTISHSLSGRVEVPIVGYEILEERSKFTVFKILVRQCCEHQQWFLFRRYTDFYRLNIQLRHLFPRFRLALPPKRWFRDNFDRNFLEDRQLALQAFLNNIVSHPDVSASPTTDWKSAILRMSNIAVLGRMVVQRYCDSA